MPEPVRQRRTTVLYELWRASRRAAAVMDSALEGAPLTGPDYGLYSLLRFSGPVTPSEVARRSGTPLTTTSQILKRLETQGHLQRSPNPSDARSVTVAMTPEGEEVHAKTSAAFQPALVEVHRHLGDELDMVIYGLARLDRALAAVLGQEPDDFSPIPAAVDDSPLHTLTYAGPPLTVVEEDETRHFIDWLRYRRSAPDAADPADA